jgi:hypothetical protein
VAKAEEGRSTLGIQGNPTDHGVALTLTPEGVRHLAEATKVAGRQIVVLLGDEVLSLIEVGRPLPEDKSEFISLGWGPHAKTVAESLARDLAVRRPATAQSAPR